MSLTIPMGQWSLVVPLKGHHVSNCKGNFWKQLHDLRDRIEVLEGDTVWRINSSKIPAFDSRARDAATNYLRFDRNYFEQQTQILQERLKYQVEKNSELIKQIEIITKRADKLNDVLFNAPDPIVGKPSVAGNSFLWTFLPNYYRWYQISRKYIK